MTDFNILRKRYSEVLCGRGHSGKRTADCILRSDERTEQRLAQLDTFTLGHHTLGAVVKLYVKSIMIMSYISHRKLKFLAVLCCHYNTALITAHSTRAVSLIL